MTAQDRLDTIESLSRAIKALARGGCARAVAQAVGELQVAMSAIGIDALDTEDNAVQVAKKAATN